MGLIDLLKGVQSLRRDTVTSTVLELTEQGGDPKDVKTLRERGLFYYV